MSIKDAALGGLPLIALKRSPNCSATVFKPEVFFDAKSALSQVILAQLILSLSAQMAKPLPVVVLTKPSKFGG